MNELEKLERQIAKFPRGTITKKVIQGKERYYLQWRDGSKVRNRYVSLSELPGLSEQISIRKELQQKLVQLQIASLEKSVDDVSRYGGMPMCKAAESSPLYKVEVRVDAKVAKKASRIFEKRGVDLSSGVEMLLRKFVQEERSSVARNAVESNGGDSQKE